jgi:chromosome segregation ATPase
LGVTLQRSNGESTTENLGRLLAERLEAEQRIGELEAKLAQREDALRELRRRLRELEEPHWEQRTTLDEQLQTALWRVAELEARLGDLGDDVSNPNSVPLPIRLQSELDAIQATKTFRYTYPLRLTYYKLRRRAMKQFDGG